MMAAASATVAVARVGTACQCTVTLPDKRSAWSWIKSNPAAVIGSPAIQSTSRVCFHFRSSLLFSYPILRVLISLDPTDFYESHCPYG
jgi:hypothetical protein